MVKMNHCVLSLLRSVGGLAEINRRSILEWQSSADAECVSRYFVATPRRT